MYQDKYREWESVEVQLRNKVQELESELVLVKKEPDQQDGSLMSRVYDLESQLTSSDASVNDVKSRHDIIAKERDELRKELQVLNTKLTSTCDTLRVRESEKDEFQRAFEVERNKVSRLQNQLDNAASTKNRLKVSCLVFVVPLSHSLCLCLCLSLSLSVCVCVYLCLSVCVNCWKLGIKLEIRYS